MMVPQPTAQYGQVERVSLARAILSVRSCAYAGFKSKPNTAAAAPPMVVSFRKSRRDGFMLGLPSARSQIKQGAARRTFLIELAHPPRKQTLLPNPAPPKTTNFVYPPTPPLHPTPKTFCPLAPPSP